MFRWIKRKIRIARLCKEHARRMGYLREYRIARAHGCSPVEALEEWDLLTNDILMKIQAEYNSLIDIELAPPHQGDCTIISIDSIGVTIRISERPAAPPPGKKQTRFDAFIVNPEQSDVLAKMHRLIDGSTPKICALTVFAAIEAGRIVKPSYTALRGEFPEIGDRKNWSYYAGRIANYAADIAAIRQNI